MGFFDDLGDRFGDGDDEEDERDTPEWLEPPENQLAGVVPLELELACNEEAAIYIARLAAYDCGFSFELHLLTRKAQRHDAFELMYEADKRPGEPPPKEPVRIGLEFADGRQAASLGSVVDGGTIAARLADEDYQADPAKDLSLVSSGGGGSMRHTQTDYWVWPLPPAGPVRFVCEWPLFEIGESSAVVEAEVIRGAAQRARTLWTSQ